MWYRTGRVFYERWNFYFLKYVVRYTEIAWDVPEILKGPYTITGYVRDARKVR